MAKNRKPYLAFLLTGFLSISILSILFFALFLIPQPEKAQSIDAYSSDYEVEEYAEWIIKWKSWPEESYDELFEVLIADQKRQLMLVRLHEGIDRTTWYEKWSVLTGIEYVEPNAVLKLHNTLPNDPELSKQNYLNIIRAPDAWRIANANRNITIAILDTGIDLNHPDLRNNLVTGLNLINPGQPPQDDHGHGTQIAGIIGAVGNNQQGVTGILWSTNLMPVKVLPKVGEGSPLVVSQGIYEAVDRGANIIVLSLGGPVFSKTLLEAVEYAEMMGVLLVAATGNDASRVNYPAAYPSVLAVGAVNDRNQPVNYSNSGPEVNIVAPGTVYTTTLSGNYGTFSGTSMSAAQAAGAAGLLLSRHPNLTPSQIRNHLMYTASDIHEIGWDSQTGHGRIQLERMLRTEPVEDIYQTNKTLSQAAPFPIETMVAAQLLNRTDEDWYRISAPYRGTIALDVKLEDQRQHGVILTFYPGSGQGQSLSYELKHDGIIQLTVPRGTSYIQLRLNPLEPNTAPIRYKITNNFTIYADAQQPNNTRQQATRLTGRGEAITGTFHTDNLKDWFFIDIPERGELDIHVTTDTLRMDPVILFERPNGTQVTIDNGNISNGQEERFSTEVEPGRHFIRLHHYFDDKVNGEYFLRVNYRPYFRDIHEPNNSREQATRIFFLQIVQANIDTRNDVDWYQIRLLGERYVQARLYRLPPNAGVTVRVLNEHGSTVLTGKQKPGESEFTIGGRLSTGFYHVVVTADQAFPFDFYTMQLTQQELVAGYRDIKGHWAEQTIVQTTQRGWFTGVGDFRFAPNEPMTRVLVADVLNKVYRYPAPSRVTNYTDISRQHWAHEPIQRVTHAGVLSGYPNGTFQPNRSITRAEAAAIVSRIYNQPMSIRTRNFSDLPRNHWAYNDIQKAAHLGLLQGYADGSFKPNEPMTRAEFATLVNRMSNNR